MFASIDCRVERRRAAIRGRLKKHLWDWPEGLRPHKKAGSRALEADRSATPKPMT